MLDTIVWATDGSEDADRALPYARELAARKGARLVVVHVVEKLSAQIVANLPVRVDEQGMQSKIERQAADLAEEGIETQVKVLTERGPHSAHAIADAAEEVGADLIVAGSRGHTPLPGLVVGSVTHRLLQIAPCPVLAVPAVGRDEDEKEVAVAA